MFDYFKNLSWKNNHDSIMKKPLIIFVYTLCLALLCNISFSQRSAIKAIGYPCSKKLAVKSADDTLEPASFATGTPTLYKLDDSIDYGYYFGTNSLGDKVQAQIYRVPKSYTIDGVALWVGAKTQVGTADTVYIRMYKLDGPGLDSVTDPVNNAPDSIITSITVPDSLLDTAKLSCFLFPSPFIVYTDYAVGVDFSFINDDTIGLISTKNGEAHRTQLSWTKLSDDTWESVLCPYNWGIDVDLGIFVIIDSSSANINDNYFVDGLKLSQNQPNPASCSTLIQYDLQNEAANVSLEIYDESGKRQLIYNEGEQCSGRHNIPVDVENIKSGVYYYSLKAGSHRLTKKMVVCN
jgi:hypothetical protein